MSIRSRLTAVLAAFALVSGGFAAVGAPLVAAAPSDASATGVRSALAVNLFGQPAISVAGSLGGVNAPPSSSVDLVNESIGVLLVASVGADAISTSATSDASGSSATSEVAGASVNVPALAAVIGGPLLEVGADVISVSASCPTFGTPTASVSPIAGLRVAGQNVTLDSEGEATVSVFGPLGLPAGNVTIRVEKTDVDSDSAAGVAVTATFNVNVLNVGLIQGTVVIAEANCESPLAVAPTASAITPPEGPVAGGTTVTVDGTGFVDGSTSVVIGGNTVPAGDVTVNGDGTELTFETPAHAAGLVEVVVSTPGGDTGPLEFTYVAAAVAPTASGINPAEGPVAGGTTVTVDGTGFVDGSTSVVIGGNTVPAGDVTVNGDGTELTFVTPAHDAGPVDVVVTTPGGDAGPLGFTYVAAAVAPTATGLDPVEGPVAGGTTVTVDGTGFVDGSTSVVIGGNTVPASAVTVNGDGTALTFLTPPHAAGPVGVVVSTPGGDTDPLGFTYVADVDPGGPTASGINPVEGPVAGGTTVKVDGTGFVPGATMVGIGGNTVVAGDVTANGDGTSLTFVTPAHAAGLVDVVVTTPGGDAGPLGFTYVEDVDPGGPTDPRDPTDPTGPNGPANPTGPTDRGGPGNPRGPSTENRPNGPESSYRSGHQSSSSLPFTGSSTAPTVYVGFMLILAGGCLLILRRRTDARA